MAHRCNHPTHNTGRLATNARRLLRGDPTRTLGISRRWIADWNRRLRKFNTALNKWLVTDDELGLIPRTTLIQLAKTFEFTEDATKLEAFQRWMKLQMEQDVLSPVGGIPGKPWTAEYVESSYKKGLFNAYADSPTGAEAGVLGVGEQTSRSFINSAFNQPETLSKVKLLALRDFTLLKDVTDSMGAAMNNILAQGIADGRHPFELAKEMQSRIKTLSRTRANTIARTEVIRAHAEGQLDAFEKLGVKELGLVAEWSTAGDDRVCPDCFGREGQIYTVDEARNLIPLHPNCRCTWVPSFRETPKKGGPKKSVAVPPSIPSKTLAKKQLEKRAFRDLTKTLAPDDFNSWTQANYEYASRILPKNHTIKGVQRNAVKSYQGKNYQAINGILRAGRLNATDVLPEFRKTILHMDDLMKKGTLPEDTFLFRGVGTKIKQPVPGDILSDAGFSSTSTSPKVASGFASPDRMPLAIRAPKGTNAIGVNPVLKPGKTGLPTQVSAESEIILPRGMKFLVTDETITREYMGPGFKLIRREYRVVDIVPQ